MNVTREHFTRALERADAMAQEDIIPEFLTHNGVDPYSFIKDARPRFARLLLTLEREEQAETFAAEFLRGLVVGILAARIAAEEEG